jgi:type II secretory pathway pseudopilin PulG
MPKNLFFQKNMAGFTLMETLVAIFIVTLIGTIIIKFQSDIFSLNKVTNLNLTAQESARQALKNFTGEVRSMSQSVAGAYYIDQAGTSSLTFYTNTDSDSATEKIRYFLDNTTLKKGTTKPINDIYNPTNEKVKIVVPNIANATTSIFSYYNNNYDGTTPALVQPVNIPDIRLIKINLIIDDDPLKSPLPIYMTTQVSIRNLKDNL